MTHSSSACTVEYLAASLGRALGRQTGWTRAVLSPSCSTRARKCLQRLMILLISACNPRYLASRWKTGAMRRWCSLAGRGPSSAL